MIEKKIDISTGIIFRIVFVLLALWLVYIIRDIIAVFFIAIIFTAAIEPAVNWMQKKKIPRPFGVLIIYLILFLVIGVIASSLVPSIIDQFKNFSKDFSQYAEKVADITGFLKGHLKSDNGEIFLKDIESNLANSSEKIFSTTIGVFSGLISLIVVLSMTFYMSVIEDGMKKFLVSVTPERHQDYIVSLITRIKEKIGRWMLGQLFLIVLIFALYYIALTILGVPYALVLAMLGGLLEIIPYIGPIISGVPAVILGLMVSPLTGLLVLIVYILIQQIENHIIVPQIMKKAIGLNPLAVILALLIGAKLAGVLGVILAVPVATAIGVFVGDLMNKPEEKKEVIGI